MRPEHNHTHGQPLPLKSEFLSIYVLLARGNLALAVAANALSCLLSVATMALTFRLYDALLGRNFAFAVPTPALVLRLALMVCRGGHSQ